MASIFDLTNYEIYRLQSVDPVLNDDWRQALAEVLPKLDKDSQKSIFQRLLKPRGILHDPITKKLFVDKPKSLEETLNQVSCGNQKLMSTAKQMLALLNLPTESVAILELADRIEAILAYFDKVELNESGNEVQIAKKIRTAFLYDLAAWIDKVDIVHEKGMRNLTDDMIKTYFKTVFIKHQIQGWDFRSWDGQDIDYLSTTHFPDYLKQEAKVRRFLIVETANYWFAVGQTNQASQNPFSFRRFLFEDLSGDGRYVYLTHVVVERQLANDPAYKERMLAQLSRLYTLERTVNEEVKLFINSAKDLLNRYLHPLLRKPLATDGRPVDEIIQERMDNYEKQLSILILNKLPRVLNFVFKEKDDTDYLYYHLDALMKQMIESVEDFRLQPLVTYSKPAQQMTVKLTCMRLLFRKTQPIFSDFTKDDREKETKLFEPMTLLKKSLEEAEQQFASLEEAKQALVDYENNKGQGGFWRKLMAKKAPDYTMDDLKELHLGLQEDLFIEIVRLAKTKRDVIIYPEFECSLVVDEDLRHYAFPDGEKGVSRLPKIITLPQNDREKLRVYDVKTMVERDIFKEVLQDMN